MRRRILMSVMAGALLVAGLTQFGQALAVPAKAWLSVRLIDHAWERALAGEADAKPWPWMDSAPVARLSVPRLEKSHIVMRGVSGSVLAFAPGWHEGTDEPGASGISLISAHRDTHFDFLRDLEAGDVIRLETAAGDRIDYEVETLKMVTDPQITVDRGEAERVLLLSTCFPFANWRPGGEMRFVVVAKALKSEKGITS